MCSRVQKRPRAAGSKLPAANNEESTQALISVDQRLDLFSEDRLVHLIDQVMASERAARLATEHFSEGLMIIDSQGVRLESTCAAIDPRAGRAHDKPISVRGSFDFTR